MNPRGGTRGALRPAGENVTGKLVAPPVRRRSRQGGRSKPIPQDITDVEPLLCAASTHELATTVPLEQTAEALIVLAGRS